jgi:hypothetical protein
LKYYVADPAKFKEKVGSTALVVFSDEIPFWVKICKQKVLFAEWERYQQNNKGTTASSLVQPSQAFEKMVKHGARRAAEKLAQKRGPAQSGD